jgi:hypothetical protein
MTIALARRPKAICAFYIWLPDEGSLIPAVDAVRELMAQPGTGISGINLMNQVRVLSMSTSYPFNDLPDGQTFLPDELVQQMAARHKIGCWMAFGAIYGSGASIRATKNRIQRVFKPLASRVLFMDRRKARLAIGVITLLPARFAGQAQKQLAQLSAGLDLLEGRPSEVALPLAYWKAKKQPPEKGLDPARDGCGLLWYAPIVPMRAKDVVRYVGMVRRICHQHGFDAPITLTTQSAYAFDSTLPLLFDAHNREESDRATLCLEALFKEGLAEGFVPYRVGSRFMPVFGKHKTASQQLYASLRQAVDPDGILAPGRDAEKIT